jgi:hypothetical protein
VATIRAPLLEDVPTTLRHRAEEALAMKEVARMRLGYEVLSTLKRDVLLDRDERGLSMGADAAHTPPAVPKSWADEAQWHEGDPDVGPFL